MSRQDEVDSYNEQELREQIAYDIRAELVCCDAYEKYAYTAAAGTTHAICFWGEAAARIALKQDESAELRERQRHKPGCSPFSSPCSCPEWSPEQHHPSCTPLAHHNDCPEWRLPI
jgi:hypothetical protein